MLLLNAKAFLMDSVVEKLRKAPATKMIISSSNMSRKISSFHVKDQSLIASTEQVFVPANITLHTSLVQNGVTVLVPTCEGTHNHFGPNTSEGDFISQVGSSTVTLDMVHGGHRLALEKNGMGMMQEVFVQQMTSSLTKDSKFPAALAAATGRLIG